MVGKPPNSYRQASHVEPALLELPSRFRFFPPSNPQITQDAHRIARTLIKPDEPAAYMWLFFFTAF